MSTGWISIPLCRSIGFFFWALLNERERFDDVLWPVELIKERERCCRSDCLSLGGKNGGDWTWFLSILWLCNFYHIISYIRHWRTDWLWERERLKMDQNSLDGWVFFVEELLLGVWRGAQGRRVRPLRYLICFRVGKTGTTFSVVEDVLSLSELW